MMFVLNVEQENNSFVTGKDTVENGVFLERRLQIICNEEVIACTMKVGHVGEIPSDAEKVLDTTFRFFRYVFKFNLFFL